MRFLITGGAGFIGSHLADHLLAANHTVVVVDNLSTGKIGNLAHQRNRIDFHCADAADDVLLNALVPQCDIVLHCAASLGVSFVTAHPDETIENNIRSTLAVLRACATYGRRIVLASTSEVYGKRGTVVLKEEDDVVYGQPRKSRWSYAASKLIDEFLTLAYGRRCAAGAVIVRLFNVIGPRQSAESGMVVPRFIEQALYGPALTVYGTGRQQRCFCDVRDVARAVVALALNGSAAGGIFNIGSSTPVAIATLAGMINDLAGNMYSVQYLPYTLAYPDGYEEVECRIPDSTAVRSAVGWQPVYTCEETLRELIVAARAARGRCV